MDISIRIVEDGILIVDRIQIKRRRRYALLLLIISYIRANIWVVDGWTVNHQFGVCNNAYLNTFFTRQRYYYRQHQCSCSISCNTLLSSNNPNDHLYSSENITAGKRVTNYHRKNAKRSTLESDIKKKLSRDDQSITNSSQLSQSSDRKRIVNNSDKPFDENNVRNLGVRERGITQHDNVAKSDLLIDFASSANIDSTDRSNRLTRNKDNKAIENSGKLSPPSNPINRSFQSNGSLRINSDKVKFSKINQHINKKRNDGTEPKGFGTGKTTIPRKSTNYSSSPSFLPPLASDGATTMSTTSTIGTVSGLSSWEEFLGGNSKPNYEGDSVKSRNLRNSPDAPSTSTKKDKTATSSSVKPSVFNKDAKDVVDNSPPASRFDWDASSKEGNDDATRQHLLPSIEDLFPLDLSFSSVPDQRKSLSANNPTSKSREANRPDRSSNSDSDTLLPPSALDGISPVSDLFYRSSQSQNQDDDVDDDDTDHDDEELPFSAEQSDAVTSEHNKIRIRRNMVQQRQEQSQGQNGNRQSGKVNNSRQRQDDNSGLGRKGVIGFSNSSSPSNSVSGGGRGRKMVRRGMEMLVGGVPINADPPQRSLELFFEAQKRFDSDSNYSDWASAISLNTRDFGPIWHSGSVNKLSLFERALFCESFCESCIKWDVCPNDFRDMVKDFKVQHASDNTKPITHGQSDSLISSSPTSILGEPTRRLGDVASNNSDRSQRSESRAKGKGSSRSVLANRKSPESDGEVEEFYQTKGEFTIEIGVSKEELESGDTERKGEVVKEVFARAFMSVLERAIHSTRQDEHDDFEVEMRSLVLAETEDGYTSVYVEFKVTPAFSSALDDMERKVKRIASIFTQAMDDGDIAVAIAAAAKDETRWPTSVRDRVVEECLFQDDDGDEPFNEKETYDDTLVETDLLESKKEDLLKPPILTPNGELLSQGLFDDVGKEGSLWDYSALNAWNAPYGGTLGLRLVQAADERAKQRQPRVIAVGDVHGCIDEFQDLLRLCDYCPGDLVVLLGDLVCKGPDSISVVQMAREIGAIGVRGNHDFEVIRWHQAIKSGVDPPVVGSEHFHIASCLSKADMKWLYSLPWYISSKELGCLFVHAGFVSGIRLAKQNPRLMMNMRSILPDGTVTSKFFNNWPWARLWDGPQTVLFGHDADRGLQQYEHALGLDTGCVYGGRLTACILPEKRLVSVSARREYFKYRRKHYD